MTTTVARRPVRPPSRPVRRPRRPVRGRPVRLALRRRVTGRRRRSSDTVWVVVAAVAGLILMTSVNAPEEAEQGQAAPQVGNQTPTAFTGAATGCVVDDPTSGGCLTGHTAHALAEIGRVFGGYRQGPMIRWTGCWDEHAWNPASDHRKGRGCDLYTGPSRQFAAGKALDDGNAVVAWLRANADVLGVSYVIWQGRIWSQEKGDRKYTGGGIYDPNDPVGGHFDHIHLSVRH